MDQLVSMMLQMESLPEFYQIPPPNSIQDYDYLSSGGSMASSSSPPPPPPPPPYNYVNPNVSMVSCGFGSADQLGNPLNSYNNNNSPYVEDPSTVCGGDIKSSTPSMGAMREMVFRIAAIQPVHIDPQTVKAPKRRNVKISKDPQSVAARHRRGRISERIRILQRLVPGGTKMDTASMLDEAIHYLKFLKTQVQSLEQVAANRISPTAMAGFSTVTGSSLENNYWCYDQQPQYNNVLR